MRLTIRIAAAAAALTVAAPAWAQGYVVVPSGRLLTTVVNSVAGQPERACMAGKKPKPADVAYARAEAIAALQRYLHLAAGPAPADTTAAFTYDASRREWLRNGSAGTPAGVDDPLARLLAARGFVLPEPDSFHRSGDGFSGLGIWRIAADGDASPGGYYRAVFRLAGTHWNLQRLEVVEGAEPEPDGQFCHSPGDVWGRRTMSMDTPPIDSTEPAPRLSREEARRASLVEAQTVKAHKADRRASAIDKRQRLKAIAGGK